MVGIKKVKNWKPERIRNGKNIREMEVENDVGLNGKVKVLGEKRVLVFL